MNALDIVLTSVLSVIVLLIIIGLIIVLIVRKSMREKVIDHDVLNKFAPENPIVFLGDSLTDFYPLQEFMHDDRLVNRGIANETTMDVEKRLDHIISLNPRAVFLQIGINNFIRSLKKVTPENVSDKIFHIADRLSEVCSDIKIISLYPVNPKKLKVSNLYLRRANNLKVCFTNSILKSRCLEKKYEYIDVHSHLTDSAGRLDKTFTIEGLHLSFAGYEVVTKVLLPYVQKVK